jgi:hypothetical protein
MNQLRVSVATYNQVVFPHPENGTLMLALERKAIVLKDGIVNVLAQPFGGGVKILNTKALQEIVREFQFDSDRSKQEQDFRILIEPSKWEAVKQYCLLHLRDPNDPELESAPDRELVEEFEETMGMGLKSSQYTVQPMGFVIEDHPVWTENWYARGFPTVRVYRTYKVEIVDGRFFVVRPVAQEQRAWLSPSKARMWVQMRSRNQRSWLTTTAQPAKFFQRFFQRAQGVHVQVVGRFVEQDHVGAFLSILARWTRLRSPPESTPTFFCWSPPVEVERGAVRARVDLAAAQLQLLGAAGDLFVDGLFRVERAILVGVAHLTVSPMRMSPLSGFSCPVIIRSRVVLPAPLGPTPTMSRGDGLAEKSSRIRRSP